MCSVMIVLVLTMLIPKSVLNTLDKPLLLHLRFNFSTRARGMWAADHLQINVVRGAWAANNKGLTFSSIRRTEVQGHVF